MDGVAPNNQPTQVLTEIRVHLRLRFSDVRIRSGQRQRRPGGRSSRPAKGKF